MKLANSKPALNGHDLLESKRFTLSAFNLVLDRGLVWQAERMAERIASNGSAADSTTVTRQEMLQWMENFEPEGVDEAEWKWDEEKDSRRLAAKKAK